jgi:hypothetical protein
LSNYIHRNVNPATLTKFKTLRGYMSELRSAARIAGDGPLHTIDREEINGARQAAEALFAPKRPIADPTTPEAMESAQQNMRKPRILSAVREQQPTDLEVTKPSVQHKIRKPRKRVPAPHLARVTTWLKYGMTIAQAADVCGVSVSEIERILQKA